ncbi:MAG TPA: GNAT family N-acetyltransferase [Bacillota bacterium]|nr:GNAT family N-acetyltransferase [Bacillota bacterium]
MNNITIYEGLPEEQAPLHLLYEADPSRKAVDDYWGRGIKILAKLESEVIGVAVLLHTRPFTMELVNIAVVERLRGEGVGKQLLAYIVALAKSRGMKSLEVGTGNSSLDQLAFYQHCGFRITGVDRDFFLKNYPEPITENGIPCLDMIRLQKEL